MAPQEFSQLWFIPLLVTPAFAIEVLFCIACCGRKAKLGFALLVALVLGVTAGFSHQGVKNRSIWSTSSGFVLHDSLKPKAVLPGTAIINVKAAGLNPADYKLMNKLGSIPFLRWATPQSPAYDMSGVVVEVGPGCNTVKVGDAVFGQSLGAVQEYSVGICRNLGVLPKSVSFVQGAASPTVTFTALVGLRKLKENDALLIVGASGGCGQAALALAKARKAGKIYCVASGKNRDEVMAKGCEVFYDYTSPDFKSRIASELNGKIDLLYDTVTEPTDIPSQYIDLLMPTVKENGNYVALNPNLDALKAENRKKFSTFVALPTREEIDYMSAHPELFSALRVSQVFDGLNVSNVYKAYEQLQSHRTVGKIVLTVGESSK
jgi:NADPH:quinone reductase-like Zn-dependent oxidoreductase